MKRRILVLPVIIVLLVSVFLAACAQTPESTSDSVAAASSSGEASSSQSQVSSGEVSAPADDMAQQYLSGLQGNHLLRFIMHITVDGTDTAGEITVAVKDDAMAYKVVLEGALVRIVQSGSDYYIVDDTQKLAMNMLAVGVDVSSFAPPQYVDETADVTGTGTDEVMGETLPYVEYGLTDGGAIRYYFDGEELAYITGEAPGEVFVLEVLEYSQDVPDSLYEIPADYTVLDSVEDIVNMG